MTNSVNQLWDEVQDEEVRQEMILQACNNLITLQSAKSPDPGKQSRQIRCQAQDIAERWVRHRNRLATLNRQAASLWIDWKEGKTSEDDQTRRKFIVITDSLADMAKGVPKPIQEAQRPGEPPLPWPVRRLAEGMAG